MIQLLELLALIIGFLHLVDRVAENEPKKKISAYILNKASVSFSAFGAATISTFIKVFLDKNGSLSLARVMLFSTFASASIFTFMVLQPGPMQEFAVLSKVGIGLITALATAYLSVPSDYFSLSITKIIFFEKDVSPLKMVPLWLVDVSCSVLVPAIPMALALYGIVEANKASDAYDSTILSLFALFTYGIAISAVTSTLISVLQLIVVLTGIILNYLAQPLLRTFESVSSQTKIDEYPLTIISLAFSLIVVFSLLAYKMCMIAVLAVFT